MYDLGFRIKQIRQQRGITQKMLAKRINKSIAAISSYESNRQLPPLEVLTSIATVLNVSLDALVGFEKGECYCVRDLTQEQKELLDLLFAEWAAPSEQGTNSELSPRQITIIQKLFHIFQESKQPANIF